VQRVTDQAGGEQIIAGPVLSVPVEIETADGDGDIRTERVRRYVVAEEAAFVVSLDPTVLRRGIYEVPAYSARVSVTGSLPSRSEIVLPVRPQERIIWSEAELVFGLSRLDGLRSKPTVAVSGAAPREVDRSTLHLGGLQTIAIPLEPARSTATPISLTMETRGGASFSVVPTADHATTTVVSDWPDPGFRGLQVPSERIVDSNGFEARWESTALGLGLSPVTEVADGSDIGYPLGALAFGVELYQPVDRYRLAERAVKYGPLFLLLPFIAIFLMEIWGGRRVHPVQYLLVAAAKLIFYLVLLSLSEHVAFAAAYWAASGATIAIIVFYLMGVLAKRTQVATMTAIVAAEYLFLYSALVSRDYALLIGSIGLFVVVAATMIATRNIDWYAPYAKSRIEPRTK
jgi:inner membrane protein